MTPAVVGAVALALSAILGLGIGCVSLFVLRVEHAAEVERRKELEARVLEVEKALRT